MDFPSTNTPHLSNFIEQVMLLNLFYAGSRICASNSLLNHVYKCQGGSHIKVYAVIDRYYFQPNMSLAIKVRLKTCLLYTSDAADERSSVDLGGRRIIKKKKRLSLRHRAIYSTTITNTQIDNIS